MTCNNCPCHSVPMTLRDSFWTDPFFKSNFFDFDRFRNEMLEQSRNMWGHFDQQLQGMQSSSSRSAIQASSSSTSSSTMKTSSSSSSSSNTSKAISKKEEGSSTAMTPFPPMRQLLRMFSDDLPDFRSFGFNFGDDDHVIKRHEDDKVFEISFDTHNYKPDEVKVTIDETHGALKVEAKHEEKSDEPNHKSYVSRQFSRQYTLPKGCKPENVVSNLSSDGVLMISAPKKATNEAVNSARQVHIEMKK